MVSRLEEIAREQTSAGLESSLVDFLQERPSLTVQSLLEVVMMAEFPVPTITETLNKIKSSKSYQTSKLKYMQLFSIQTRHRLPKSEVL